MSEPVHVVCPHCGTTIRVPAARLGESPKCAKCHQQLFDEQPADLDAKQFEAQLAHSALPLVVDFWAPWCGPCVMMAPAFASAAGRLEPRYRLARLNTDAEPQVAGRFGIRSIPTMILFHGGREIARHSGAVGTEQIVQWVRSHAPATAAAG